MKTTLLALALLATPAFADIDIADNHKELAVDCAKDPNITIAGNHAKLTLTGTCARIKITGNHASITGSATEVSVMGNHNEVALDAVDRLSIMGNHNKASWKKAADAKLKKPKVANLGKYNKVTQAK